MSLETYAQCIAEQFLRLLNPSHRPSKSAAQKAKVIAHRGLYPGYKENNLESFIACKNAGVWGIEFDIRWTKDLVPVIIHDPSTSHIFNTDYYINDCTISELKQVHPEIPTLKEVVAEVAPSCHLMIELKEPLTIEKNKILEGVLSTLKPISNYHLMSLDVEILNTANKFPKKCLLSIALFNSKKTLKATLESKIAGMAGSYILLTDSFKKRLEQQNMVMGTGFIDSKYALYKELNRGVEYLFTNKPAQIMQKIQEILNS